MRNKTVHSSPVGIDDVAAYIPRHYLPIETLAVERGIDPDKLTKGLGLSAMALPDIYEDTATMAANAARQLIERSGLKPQDIGRIYLGTESALDGAKPTATYALEMLRRYYRKDHGVDCFTRCDVIDMTFACIGGVDALLNTVDWVRAGKGRIGIVIASDFAKYELGSTGEYTQGAGAIAMLVKESPSLLSIMPEVGVATRGVHDFFKPIRQVDKADLVKEVLKLLPTKDKAEDVLSQLPESFEQSGVLDSNDQQIGVHVMTPTFDGPYSNWTYQRRVREAYDHFVEQVDQPVDEQPIFTWARAVMHLPYAAHGRRMLMDTFVRELDRQGMWDDVASSSRIDPIPRMIDFKTEQAFDAAWDTYMRAVSKTRAYISFVSEQLKGSADASSLTGNLYAGSIFMALMSTLVRAEEMGDQLAGKTIGLIGYGSGSKSKVFAGSVRSPWEKIVKNWKLFEGLNARTPVDYATYEKLHRGQLKKPLAKPKNTFVLDHLGKEENKMGARYYKWIG
ncbi:MAG: hydroxymethylglutaryl-CoA synthase family protein [Saprospiraceae bacterium]